MISRFEKNLLVDIGLHYFIDPCDQQLGHHHVYIYLCTNEEMIPFDQVIK